MYSDFGCKVRIAYFINILRLAIFVNYINVMILLVHQYPFCCGLFSPLTAILYNDFLERYSYPVDHEVQRKSVEISSVWGNNWFHNVMEFLLKLVYERIFATIRYSMKVKFT